MFVNGCFWHHHKGCKLAYTPKKNQYFWVNKFEENTKRNNRVYFELIEQGWRVFVIWECELGELDTCSEMQELLAWLEKN